MRNWVGFFCFFTLDMPLGPLWARVVCSVLNAGSAAITVFVLGMLFGKGMKAVGF